MDESAELRAKIDKVAMRFAIKLEEGEEVSKQDLEVFRVLLHYLGVEYKIGQGDKDDDTGATFDGFRKAVNEAKGPDDRN